MKKGLHISLRPGERIFVNGAVLKVDRKVSIEFLNDVTFLLEHHVLQPEDTRTPLRQLYFIIQTALIDPVNGGQARAMCEKSLSSLMDTFENVKIRDALNSVRDLVDNGRLFDALKALRPMFAVEDKILAEGKRPGAANQHQREAC